MRILLLAVALAAGIAVGATVPAVSGFVRNTLSAAGVPPTLFAFTAGPEATSPAAKADHAAGDGHDHAEPDEEAIMRSLEQQVLKQLAADGLLLAGFTG